MHEALKYQNYNTLYLRDSLFELIISDCQNNRIDSVASRNFKDVQSFYDYTFKAILAVVVYNTASELLSRSLSMDKEKFHFQSKLQTASSLCNVYRSKVMPEILTVAWLSTDSFNWSKVPVLPKAIQGLKNSLQYPLQYGLVTTLYQPICLYAMTLLQLQDRSPLFNDFLLSIPDITWDGINDRTRDKVLKIFESRGSYTSLEIEEVYSRYTKLDYLNR